MAKTAPRRNRNKRDRVYFVVVLQESGCWVSYVNPTYGDGRSPLGTSVLLPYPLGSKRNWMTMPSTPGNPAS
ncbi:hypothetical protein [Coleofasciculus sp. F4-SAH-05]|uniref:hypothetical protein n=1 Tax=Coleofasciculus sp. F4-SAH-05 TaxID=3069525 RepID=UPI0032FF2F43